MQVIVTSTPGAGHIHPLVPVARALAAAGHDVVWATAAPSCGRVEAFGFTAMPAGLDPATRRARLLEQTPDAMSVAPRDRRRAIYPMFSRIAAPAMMPALARILDEVGPDLVLHEPLEWAAAPLAEARGIPHVTVGFGALLPDDLLEVDVESRADLWESVGLEPATDGGLYDRLYLHPCPPSIGPVPADLPIELLKPVGFDGVLEEDPPRWLQPLGRERPCIYVTFGTEFAAMAPFGAVAEAADGLDADVVMTVSQQVDPSSLGSVPANVRVEQYLPQRWVLARSSLLVSHAGSGAVLGGAAYGLPQLCLPISADQFDNADAVTAAGLGATLEPEAISPTSIRDGMERLLTPDHRRRAEEVAAEIAAMPEPSAYVDPLTAIAT